MKSGSLQRRLVVAFALLGLLVSVAFAWFVDLQLRRTLRGGIQAELARRVTTISALCEWEHGAPRFEATESERANLGMFGDFVVCSLPGMEVIGGYEQLRPDLQRVLASVLPGVIWPVTIAAGSSQEALAMVGKFEFAKVAANAEEPEQPAFAVAVMAATTTWAMNMALAETRTMLLIGCLLVTSCGALLGARMARTIVRPLRALSVAAASAGRSVEPMPRSGRGDEIDGLAAALDAAFERLSAARERERCFAADASHELRTPLAIVRTTAEVALRSPDLVGNQGEALTEIGRAHV